MLPPESSAYCYWGREKQNRYFPSPEITGCEGSTGGFLMTHPVCVLATIHEPLNFTEYFNHKKALYGFEKNGILLKSLPQAKAPHWGCLSRQLVACRLYVYLPPNIVMHIVHECTIFSTDKINCWFPSLPGSELWISGTSAVLCLYGTAGHEATDRG